MKKIKLALNVYALVDDEDYEELSKQSWFRYGRYAGRLQQRNGIRKAILMHRVIAGTPPGLETDHINGNPLDNRRSNLRWATKSQNLHNRQRVSGVRKMKDGRKLKWVARLCAGNKRIHVGQYRTKREAVAAYHEAKKKYVPLSSPIA